MQGNNPLNDDELQQLIGSKDTQINNLKAQNEELSVKFVLTKIELEKVNIEKAEIQPLRRRLADLELHLITRDRTIEELRQERQRQLVQLNELTLRNSELQQQISIKNTQINTLQVQNEGLSTKVVLTSIELEKFVREKAESEPLLRKIADLEQHLISQEILNINQQDQFQDELNKQKQYLSQENERLNSLLNELTARNYELDQLTYSNSNQIEVLKAQNETLSTRFVLTSVELEKVTKEKTETESQKRKIADLEQYVIAQEKTIQEQKQENNQKDLLCEEIKRLMQYLNNLKMQKDQESEQFNRTKKYLEDQNYFITQERDRLDSQLKELTSKICEFQQFIYSQGTQINTLQAKNEALSTRFVLTTAELEKVANDQAESKRKIADLEQYQISQNRTIDYFRYKCIQMPYQTVMQENRSN